jgi:hypothetical protein
VERKAPSRVACLAIRSDGKHEFSPGERALRNLASSQSFWPQPAATQLTSDHARLRSVFTSLAETDCFLVPRGMCAYQVHGPQALVGGFGSGYRRDHEEMTAM